MEKAKEKTIALIDDHSIPAVGFRDSKKSVF